MTNLIEFFKTLSDETRLRILVLLFCRELCVCELCDILNAPQPKISRHLAKLRDLGFVADKRQGQWIFYYINLNDDILIEMLNAIVKNVDKYPVLKRDMEQMQSKAFRGQLCKREI